MRKWLAGKIVEKKAWAEGLFSLFIEATVAPFMAGQFIQLCAEPENPSLFRPYSLANAPSDPILEIYFDLIQGGQLSPQLAQLNVGDTIGVGEKAAGRFVLTDIPNCETLWLMATGTGLGPFLSILKTQEVWDRFAKIVLVHSVRFASGLSHQPFIQALEQRYSSQFHFIPLVTRETVPGILSQRIQTLIQAPQLLADLPLNAESSQVMLCGNPHMVMEVSAALQSQGLRVHRAHQPGHITLESYWK